MMKTIAGDFGEDNYVAISKSMTGKAKKVIIAQGMFKKDKKYNPSDVSTVELIDQENAATLLGAAGWGLAGAALLGPIGLLGGLIGGSRKNISVIAVEFKDGKKVLIEGKSKETREFVALVF